MARQEGITKVETLGLGEYVQGLLKRGVITNSDVTGACNEELARRDKEERVSRATVGRYLQKVRDKINPDAFKTIQDHVAREVPKDLDALEEIETVALEWFREKGDDQVKRLTEAALDIAGEIDSWFNMLVSLVKDKADEEKYEKAKKGLARKMLARALSYFKNDANMQAQRQAAAKLAKDIIALKLSNAGLLDEEGKNRIVFLTRDESERQRLPGGGQKLFVISREKTASGGTE